MRLGAGPMGTTAIPGQVAKPKKSNRQPPWGRFAGDAEPLRGLVLLRREITPFVQGGRAGNVWVPGDPKQRVRRQLDRMVRARSDAAILTVVTVGAEARSLRPGQRVLCRTSASLACPGCGLGADRRDPLDSRLRATCRRCRTRWPREEGIAVGGHGFNPASDTDGPRWARSSSYLLFKREADVVAVLAGGGDVLEANAVVVPLGDRVLVRRVDEVKKIGSLEVPEAHREKPVEGYVVAVGPGAEREDGSLRPISVQVGDRVLFGKFAGVEVEVGGVEHVLFREEDILARVSPGGHDSVRIEDAAV